jgi:2-octaprenyl-6-methoxyphenol hydroxylase
MVTETGNDCDVLIVGGGLVGSLLANALSALPLSVTLVEARRVDTLEQPSFDGRASALANGSQRVLEQLGLWRSISPEAQPIRHIHIGQRGRFGAARIEASEEGVDALGYTVENRVLGSALWAGLEGRPGFTCLALSEVQTVDVRDDHVHASISSENGPQEIDARLLVAADGARSPLREALGITARVDNYGQCAVIVNCTTTEPHRGRAFERFTSKGPIAVLPLTRNRVAVVWVLPAADAEAMLALDEDAFRSALQDTCGYRLGRFETIGRRDMHPLYRVQSDAVIAERAVLIGNAAVALHPVAGQGFNLALRDIAALAELIAGASHSAAGQFDVGDAALLDAYRAWRTTDQRKLASFTHALVRGFGNDWPGASHARSLALMAFDLVPGAKSQLARHTMGLGGRVPKLARGLSLG